MYRTILILFAGLTLLGSSLISPVQASGVQNSKAFKDSLPKAEGWLNLMDQSLYVECFHQTSSLVQEQQKEETWINALTATRATFGKVVKRVSQAHEFYPEGFMDGSQKVPGQIIKILFQTDFEGSHQFYEVVGLRREGGSWVPLSYQFVPIPDPNADSSQPDVHQDDVVQREFHLDKNAPATPNAPAIKKVP